METSKDLEGGAPFLCGKYKYPFLFSECLPNQDFSSAQVASGPDFLAMNSSKLCLLLNVKKMALPGLIP